MLWETCSQLRSRKRFVCFVPCSFKTKIIIIIIIIIIIKKKERKLQKTFFSFNFRLYFPGFSEQTNRERDFLLCFLGWRGRTWLGCCLFLLARTLKKTIDLNGPNRPKRTEWDRKRPKRTEWTEIDQST